MYTTSTGKTGDVVITASVTTLIIHKRSIYGYICTKLEYILNIV